VVAGYLGQLAVSIALIVAVERIVFGGGVMSSGALLPLVRAAVLEYLNGYVAPLSDAARVQDYICAPGLGDDVGIVGALLLAAHARDER
jgi:fructokinase